VETNLPIPIWQGRTVNLLEGYWRVELLQINVDPIRTLKKLRHTADFQQKKMDPFKERTITTLAIEPSKIHIFKTIETI
jgi:hypothetical protein